MKRLLLILAIGFALNSCSSDDALDYHYEFLAIDSHNVPQSFTLGETYLIKFQYKKPTTCHSYHRVFFESVGNRRDFAIQSIVVHKNDCLPLTDEIREVNFNFIVRYTDPYLFRFYKGDDNSGHPIFEEIEIPVN